MRLLLYALLALLIPSTLPAQDTDDASRALEAVRRGEIQPLSAFLPGVERRFQGRVLSKALLEQGEGFNYRFKILTDDGRLIDVVLDARSGRVLTVAADAGDADDDSDEVSVSAGAAARPGVDDDDDDGDDDDDDSDDDDDDDDEDDGDDDDDGGDRNSDRGGDGDGDRGGGGRGGRGDGGGGGGDGGDGDD